MIAMKFTIELDIGLSFLLQAALPQLVTDRETKTHRRGRSKRSYGHCRRRTEIPEAERRMSRVQPVYVDHGLTGTNRERPGLREAACRAGDTLVVTKLDRLARSLPDAREILAELTRRGISLSLGGAVNDPTDPVGRLLFNVLAMVAEFEADLIRLRTREGMKIAKAKGRLRGKQPKLNPRQEAHLVALHRAGDYTTHGARGPLRGCPLHRLPGDPAGGGGPAAEPPCHGQGAYEDVRRQGE